ncbi:MAG: glycosyltransferase family 39 protein [Calditrichaeota bacterium]|nr:glycosyltransferase family 39 protein [Calditrichota bacterium]MCB9367651.1 glycosyltransferase family 39 protein [Calditrichota bacterium]
MTEWTSLRRDSGRILDYVLLTAMWAVMTWIANPIANIPLNDDWTYAVSVKALVEDGRFFFLTEWANKTLVAHVLWGALFCLPFGFSYNALRVSQLAAGLIGIFALYKLCLELGASRRVALLCAATLLANPLYFQIANSFMTDIDFTAFTTLAVLWIVRGLFRRASAWTITGWTLLVLTVWVRELAAMIPAGYAAFKVYVEGFRRSAIAKAILPGIVILILLIIHQKVMVEWLGFPNLDNPRTNAGANKLMEKPLRFFMNIPGRTVHLFLYIGLYSLPFVPWMRTKTENRHAHKVGVIAATAFAVLMVIGMFMRGMIMPLLNNSLGSIGLGPFTLRDAFLLHLPNLPTGPVWPWVIVTLVGLWAGAKVVQFVVTLLFDVCVKSKEKRAEPRRALTFFLLAATAFYSLLMVTSGFYDRYLLIYIPMTAALFALNSENVVNHVKSLTVFSYVVIGFFCIYGALSTHDYISWNRVRWELVGKLTNQMGVTPQQLDGGYEVNGSLNFLQEKTMSDDKSWWWVTDDEYMITFGAVPGYEIIEKRPFPNYMFGDDASVCILKRVE